MLFHYQILKMLINVLYGIIVITIDCYRCRSIEKFERRIHETNVWKNSKSFIKLNKKFINWLWMKLFCVLVKILFLLIGNIFIKETHFMDSKPWNSIIKELVGIQNMPSRNNFLCFLLRFFLSKNYLLFGKQNKFSLKISFTTFDSISPIQSMRSTVLIDERNCYQIFDISVICKK